MISRNAAMLNLQLGIPAKSEINMATCTIWRCISDWKWGISVAISVHQNNRIFAVLGTGCVWVKSRSCCRIYIYIINIHHSIFLSALVRGYFKDPMEHNWFLAKKNNRLTRQVRSFAPGFFLWVLQRWFINGGRVRVVSSGVASKLNDPSGNYLPVT